LVLRDRFAGPPVPLGPGPSFHLHQVTDDFVGLKRVDVATGESVAKVGEQHDRGCLVPLGGSRVLGNFSRLLRPNSTDEIGNCNQRAPVVGGSGLKLTRQVRVTRLERGSVI
jgi:hypothetical protein